ncbi:uncharacterized protein LOC131659399 [Vicia villosa]|uniref:uncharacterized protein LOC131659399 n=1 Tax=Vicia villosa TaxID=3911 RepID=UPI00273C1473|nr:uncharacterized protein LOC131659399 [Vicia villosa]
MQEFCAKSFWCNTPIGYSFSNSCGLSGGLITLWKEGDMKVLYSFKGANFLGIKVLWKSHYYYIVNVYPSCLLSKKKELWEKLLELKEANKDGEWLIGGDFNAIKHRRERKGRALLHNNVGINLFADFIARSELVDVPCKGKNFSWYSGDGKSMSRIDRFLISNTIINRWHIISQKIGERDISDHCPVWLVFDNNDWGPKLFKFTNEWFSLKSFIPFVEKEWKEIKVEGRGDFVLKEKLRILKERLRWWNKYVFGKINLEVEENVKAINFGDEFLEVEGVDNLPAIVLDRNEANGRFWLYLRIKENMLAQKSKVKWLKDGDCNSSFFHKAMREKRRHNHIGPLLSSGSLFETVEDVKEEVWRHFSDKFWESESIRRALEGMSFKSISTEEQMGLESPFLESEIKDAIWDCGISKSPGPDGCMYKAISKLLAGRLKKVLNSIISPCQTAFVSERQLLDMGLVANEVVDFAHKEGRNCLLFKVDFEKAYGNVNWNFLKVMLQKMGFGVVWRRWMDLLIFQSKMLVLVNGSPTKEFVVEKGLRQGDPLSPFLFVLVTEALTGLVRKSMELGEYCGLPVKGRLEASSFTFLGIPIRGNPRKCSFWVPLMNKMKKRLSGWKNRFLNLGGRITLLKLVLCSLSIFTMSFFKMPLKVVKEFTSIQGNFLWGGMEEKKKIHWVCYERLRSKIVTKRKQFRSKLQSQNEEEEAQCC